MVKKRGFTLVELLAVIVVLTIILSIAIPGISGVIKSATKASFKSDAKMVLQAIEYKKLESYNFNPLEITKENMEELLGISSLNYGQVNISVTDNNTEVILVGEKNWNGFTAYGSMKTMKVVNTDDYDVVPPAITIWGDNPVSIGKDDIYIDAGATAFDSKDGALELSLTVIKNSANEVVLTIDTSIFSTYTITYTVEDSQGNSTSSIRRVNVVDKKSPVITILGENPTILSVGQIYSDAGATALDDTDGNITSDIVITGSINPNVVGTYSITYTVDDNAQNTATVTRTINVIDDIKPTINFSITGNSTYAKVRNTVVSVSDAHTGIDNSSIKYLWSTSTIEPPEASFGSSFVSGETITSPIDVTGSYYLWILVKDKASNRSIVRTNVFNLDNTKPVIILNGSGSVTINKGSTYSDAGATVTDNEDTSVSVISSGTVNVNTIGTYTITYTAIDTAGNAALSITRTVSVVDVSAPMITIIGTNPITLNVGSIYSDAGATALDDVDGNLTSNIVKTGTVNPNVVGVYTITYSVKDNANNQAIASRVINVIDITAPTAPTALGMTYADGATQYVNNTWSTVAVYMYGGISGSTDAGGILKYQISSDNVNWVDYVYDNSALLYRMTSDGIYYRYARAMDNAGNVSSSISRTIKIDHTAPSSPTVIGMTYADGITQYPNNTWTTVAVYMYGGISGSIDANSGILKYQISSDNVTWVDYVYDNSTLLYRMTSDGTYYRYARAIDNAGNVSSSSSRTIKIDHSGPAATFSPNSMAATSSNIPVIVTPTDTGVGTIYRWRYRLSSNGGSAYGAWQGVPTGYDSSLTYTLAGGATVPVFYGAYMNLTVNQKYMVDFDYRCATGNVIFQIDLYPDTLPEVWLNAATTQYHYNWDNVTSSSSDMNAASLRFFSGSVVPNPTDIYISNVYLYPKGIHTITLNTSGNWIIQVETTDTLGNTNIITSGTYIRN